jgi:hypothetical protein
VAGLLVGTCVFGWRRTRFLRRRARIKRSLTALGEDASRPTVRSHPLAAYGDAQLILLRSEHEYLVERWGGRARGAGRLFEGSFGFFAEDGFESGPLNVAPGTEGMERLRGLWESRLLSRRSFGAEKPAALGLREERAYGVFPKAPGGRAEAAARQSYLALSRELLDRRYGGATLPEDLRRRAEREVAEYEALTGRRASKRWR